VIQRRKKKMDPAREENKTEILQETKTENKTERIVKWENEKKEQLEVVEVHFGPEWEEPETKDRFVKWTDIGAFHNVVSDVKKFAKLEHPDGKKTPFDVALKKPISYRPKVKLHGSNCAVGLDKDGLWVQSRNQIITVSDERATTKETQSLLNVGSIIYPDPDTKKYFLSLFPSSSSSSTSKLFQSPKKILIFGEFCGPKVQKGVACSQTKERFFAIFSVQVDNLLILEPEDIRKWMTNNGEIALPPRIYIIPWHTSTVFNFTFVDPAQMEKELIGVNKMVSQIEKEDPWVMEHFGIKGGGEGVVLYPVNLMSEYGGFRVLQTRVFSAFVLKAKGEEHRVVAQKKAAQVNPETAASEQQYCKIMMAEARCQQGAKEVGGLDMKNIPKFVRWLVADVKKEGQVELEASGLQWKAVEKVLNKKASEWYIAEVRKQAMQQSGS